jgi:hypothetical protein
MELYLLRGGPPGGAPMLKVNPASHTPLSWDLISFSARAIAIAALPKAGDAVSCRSHGCHVARSAGLGTAPPSGKAQRVPPEGCANQQHRASIEASETRVSSETHSCYCETVELCLAAPPPNSVNTARVIKLQMAKSARHIFNCPDSNMVAGRSRHSSRPTAAKPCGTTRMTPSGVALGCFPDKMPADRRPIDTWRSEFPATAITMSKTGAIEVTV